MIKLVDLSPMSFGLHKDKPMQDVPAKYLLWLWNEGLCDLVKDEEIRTNRHQVAWYIAENLTVLQQEDKDTIVKRCGNSR